MDIWRAVQYLEEPDVEEWKPSAPSTTANALATAIFTEEVKEFMLRKRTYNNNKTKAYTVVLGKCTEAMKAKLEGQDTWSAIHDKHDLVGLLKSIKIWMLNQQNDRNPVVSTYFAL